MLLVKSRVRRSPIGFGLAKIQNVTGTAFIVAELRSHENVEANPLYVDPVVSIFLDETTKRAAASISAGFPLSEKFVRIRTRYLDDKLDEYLNRGCRQVVILGSGLDTRAVRKQAHGVTYFEIDDPDTLNFKKARLAERGLTASVTYIPADYISDGVIGLLGDNGFDFELPAYFIWEGNTVYLTKEAVINLLTDLSSSVGRFGISFDYMSEEVVSHRTGDQRMTDYVERFAAMGAPWRFGINDSNAIAKTTGMTIVDNIKTADLYKTYRPRDPSPDLIFKQYSLCTLEPNR